MSLIHSTTTHHYLVPLTNISCFTDFVKIYVESRNKVHFSAAVIAGSMKPCIVIVLDTLNNHLLWHGALDLHFMLHWLCPNFMSSLELKCISLQQRWLWEWNLASTNHDPFFAWPTLHAVVISPNAGAILTSAEFLSWWITNSCRYFHSPFSLYFAQLCCSWG